MIADADFKGAQESALESETLGVRARAVQVNVGSEVACDAHAAETLEAVGMLGSAST